MMEVTLGEQSLKIFTESELLNRFISLLDLMNKSFLFSTYVKS